MLVAKVYTSPNKVEFWHLVRYKPDFGFLVNYPLWVPYHARHAKWVQLDKLLVDWVFELED
jgi:hypothetical protein